MRKAHEKLIRFLLDRKEGSVGARDVICKEDHIQYPKHSWIKMVWLYHGNPIARVDAEGVFVNWQGWSHAQSTRERIYALCAYVGADRPDKNLGGWIKIV